MKELEVFVEVVRAEFPDDRLTFQRNVPTFHPENAGEAARLFQLANEHRQKLFITGFGNNIDPQGEPFTQMVAIRTDRLNRFIEVAPGDFYVTVGGGYPLREINLHLKEYGLFLPHGLLPYVGSVGGALALNLTADYRDHDLPIKRYFLKAEIVNPQGEIITPGSVCFKSVSGYDIVRLFSPSWGLLGLIVSATFRVTPSTVLDDFSDLRMQAIDRQRFLAGFDASSDEADVVYARKIRARFDPNEVLPIVG
jgi:FAD/FMN-containing dehydrogenase